MPPDSPPFLPPKETVPQGAEFVRMDTVSPKPIEWLWQGRIALGKISFIAGDPGLGKSLLTLSLAAHVTTGNPWPVDGTKPPIGSVIILTAEDDLEDTVRPRLDAAGADVQKIMALQMVNDVDEMSGKAVRRSFSLERDLPKLEKGLDQLPDCRLITIDPVSAYTGKTDTHKNADVRGLLAPLAELAQRRNVAIVCVTHLNKGAGNAMYRSIGSIAFVAAARAAYAVVKDQDNDCRRLLLPIKNNLGPDQSGLAYSVIQGLNNDPYLDWEKEPVSVDINDAMSTESDEYRSERQDAAEWLEHTLADGPVEVKELKRLAVQAGHSWRTVQRSKAERGIEAIKPGFSEGWRWGFPKSATEHEGRQPLNGGTLGDDWRSSLDISADKADLIAQAAQQASSETGREFLPADLVKELEPSDLNDPQLMTLERLVPYAVGIAKRSAHV